MTDTPLTEDDFDCSVSWIKAQVQDAKLLLKLKMSGWNCSEEINEIIDACFQIPDGDDEK